MSPNQQLQIAQSRLAICANPEKAFMKSISNRFLLSSDDCETLLEFENVSSLSALAERIGRDHSVVARSLKRMSEEMPVVEKQDGKWRITRLGKRMNEITRTMIAAQHSAVDSQKTLRIGTNREFAARVLAPKLGDIVQMFPRTIITLNSYEDGVEDALVNQSIDIGIDCERPNNPDISYKHVIGEPILAVCHPEFYNKFSQGIQSEDYLALPHLLCERLFPDKILNISHNQYNTFAKFNDIASTRSACLQGLGWALLPRYTILEELASRRLVQLSQKTVSNSKYGIWWLRRHNHLRESVRRLAEWLIGLRL